MTEERQLLLAQAIVLAVLAIALAALKYFDRKRLPRGTRRRGRLKPDPSHRSKDD